MLKLIERVMARSITRRPFAQLRSVRPSLLDLRFTGDPSVVDHADGTASVRLDDYGLARIQTLPFDVPSLYQQFLQLRQGQMRRCLNRQRSARERQGSNGNSGHPPIQ